MPVQEKNHERCNQQCYRGGIAQALWSSHCPECLTWSYRLNNSPAEFWAGFGPIGFHLSFSPFWNDNVYPQGLAANSLLWHLDFSALFRQRKCLKTYLMSKINIPYNQLNIITKPYSTLWNTGCLLSQSLLFIMKKYQTHIASLETEQNSKFKVWSPLNIYHLLFIIKSKCHKLNHHKLKTFCSHKGSLKGSLNCSPRTMGWKTKHTSKLSYLTIGKRKLAGPGRKQSWPVPRRVCYVRSYSIYFEE